MSDVTIKGAGLKPNFDWIRQTYGEDAWREIIESLDPQDRSRIEIVSPTLMYPISVFDHVCVAFADRHYLGDRSGAASAFRRMGEFAAQAELSGIYSAFLKIGSPEMTFKRAANLLATLYTGVSADASVTDEGDGKRWGVLTVRGLGEVAYASPRLVGFAEYTFSKLRVKDLRVSERSWDAGALRSDELIFDVRWVQ